MLSESSKKIQFQINGRTDLKNDSINVHAIVVKGLNRLAATTLDDIPPSLGLSVGLPDNLLAFVLRHLRCVGTKEKFALCNIKVPLMRSRRLLFGGFVFFFSQRFKYCRTYRYSSYAVVATNRSFQHIFQKKRKKKQKRFFFPLSIEISRVSIKRRHSVSLIGHSPKHSQQ